MSSRPFTLTYQQPAYAAEATRLEAETPGARQHRVEVLWDFGDGLHAIGETVDHVYAGAGEYAVSAVAANLTDGTVATAQIQVSVNPAREMATAEA